MKLKLTALAGRYEAALRKHLRPGARQSLQPALRLGRQAVALGLETLELARVHERARVNWELSHRNNGIIKQAPWDFC
ncbi:MAG: hypothetical protein HY299_01750 [Verrucomicrobia bacterium]|nr:hypothetical protein [Verrucomicrobiota bacterium]